MVMIFGWMWGSYPHSVGLEVRIALPSTLTADLEERIILTVQSPPFSNEPELRLNSRPVSRGDLRAALRAELSRRAHRVVYVQGEPCLSVGDVVRVIDIARDAWYGVPVVLMTPELEKSLKLPPR
jgi:biopolymer transport protein ExbD